MSAIQASLQRVLANLRGIDARPVRLVAVSKTKPGIDILEAYNAGQRCFGENYVAELCEKAPALPSDIQWHFIGHLQSNKVHKLISGCPNLYMIETVDSVKLASKINLALDSTGGGPLRVLIEVKTSSEESKNGVPIVDVPPLVMFIKERCPKLKFSGLMTMANPVDPQICFRTLSEVAHQLRAAGHEVETLSMGMSGDYALAIRNGSTQVRIGSSIFGSR